MITATRQHKHQYNKNNQKIRIGRKNNYMHILSDKQTKLHTKILDMARIEKAKERNWISADSSKEQCHKDFVKEIIDKAQ